METKKRKQLVGTKLWVLEKNTANANSQILFTVFKLY